MLGLSERLSSVITNLRTVEIDSSSRYRKILIMIIFFCEYQATVFLLQKWYIMADL